MGDHGIQDAVYANNGFGHSPLIICLCGWTTGTGAYDSWEAAGAAFDDHLAEERDVEGGHENDT